MKTPARILLTALLALVGLQPQAHSQRALQKKEYTGNHGNKVLVHYDPAHCILKDDTLYVIHRPTTLVLEMKPANKDWEYEEGNSTLKPGEHPADPSKIPLGTEQELFPSEIASFHLTAKSTRDDIAINVVLVHVKAFVELPQGRTYCDGEINIPVHIKIQPEWLKEHTEKVELEFESPKVCDNPAGMCSKLFKDDPVGWLWRIDNVRWFSTQPDQCNDESTYVLGGETLIQGTEIKLETAEMNVDGSAKCVNGKVVFLRGVEGHPKKNCVNLSNNPKYPLFSCTIEKGTLLRSIVTKVIYEPTRPSSQFYPMVVAEENYHSEKQMKNPEHTFYRNYYIIDSIFEELKKKEPFLGLDEEEAARLIDIELRLLLLFEYIRLKKDSAKYECELEKETKSNCNPRPSHVLKMKCAYPHCP